MAVNKWRLFILAAVVLCLGAGLGGAIYWKQRRTREAGRLQDSLAKNLAAGRFDHAVLEANRLVRLAKDNPDAHLMRARAYLAGRDPSALRSTDPDGRAAVQSLLAAVRINPTLPEPNRQLLAYHLATRNFADARPFAEALAKAIPDDPDANLALARVLAQDPAKGSAEEARRRLELVIQQEPKPVRPRVAIVAALVDEALGKAGGKLHALAEDWLLHDCVAPRELTVEDRLSLVELRAWSAGRATAAPVIAEQLGAALRELEALGTGDAGNDLLPGYVLEFAERLVPPGPHHDAATEAALATLRLEADRVIGVTFRKAVERKTPDPRVYTTYADRLRNAGKDDEAAKIVEQGLANVKDSSDHVRTEFGAARLWLTKHFLSKAQPDAAEPHVAELLANERWKPWGQLMQGYIFTMKGDSAAAAKPLSECLQSPDLKDNGAAHALYGLCMLRTGHPNIGRQHLERGKAAGADSPQLRAWLALALAQAGDGAKALELARQVSGANAPLESRAVGDALLGELQLAAGNLDDAERSLDAALQALDPKFRWPVLLAKAQVKAQREDWTGAQALLDQVKAADVPEAARAFALEAKRWR